MFNPVNSKVSSMDEQVDMPKRTEDLDFSTTTEVAQNVIKKNQVADMNQKVPMGPGVSKMNQKAPDTKVPVAKFGEE